MMISPLLRLLPLFVATSALSAAPAASKCDAARDMKEGFSVPVWSADGFDGPNYPAALDEIVAVGSNWIALNPDYYQDEPRSTTFKMHRKDSDNSSPTLESLRNAVRLAHERALKVLLKPHIDLMSHMGWRGMIGEGMTDEERAAWFVSYTSLMLEQARMAQEEGVAMLALGTELNTMQEDEAAWRALAAAVREVYKGELTYCANHGSENRVKFWDVVDYIGIDAYYPLSKKMDPTVEELVAAWEPIAARIEKLSKQYDRPVLFTEIGYVSRDGTTIKPWEWTLPNVPDPQEQADAYAAFFQVFWCKPWFQGAYFWRWGTEPDAHGVEDLDFMVEGKPAEAIVRKWYGAKDAEATCCQRPAKKTCCGK